MKRLVGEVGRQRRSIETQDAVLWGYSIVHIGAVIVRRVHGMASPSVLQGQTKKKERQRRQVTDTRISHALPLSIIGSRRVAATLFENPALSACTAQRTNSCADDRQSESWRTTATRRTVHQTPRRLAQRPLFLILHLLQTFHRSLQSPPLPPPISDPGSYYIRNGFEYTQEDSSLSRIWNAYARPPHVARDPTPTRPLLQSNSHIGHGP